MSRPDSTIPLDMPAIALVTEKKKRVDKNMVLSDEGAATLESTVVIC